MTYSLFLDDERDPVDSKMIIARSTKEAIHIIETMGMPIEMCLDHDLGGMDTTMDFLQWLCVKILDDELEFPPGFFYSIHSQNPIGAKRIEHFMCILIGLSMESKAGD